MFLKKLVALDSHISPNKAKDNAHNILRKYSIDYRKNGWFNTESFLEMLPANMSKKEFRLVISAIWDINHINSHLPKSILDKLVENINKIDMNTLSAILSPTQTSGPQFIHAVKKAIPLNHKEERYMWKIFEQTSPSHFYDRSTLDRDTDMHFDEFISRVKKVLTRNSGPKKVLEIGCGNNGNVIRELANNPKMDISQANGIALRIDNFPKGEKTTLTEANMKSLPFQDNSFDVIFEFKAFIYAIDDQELQQTLSEALRVLRPGGILLISETNLTSFTKIRDLLNSLGHNYFIKKTGVGYIIRKNSEEHLQNMDYNTDPKIKRKINTLIQRAIPKRPSQRGLSPK